LSTNRRNRKSQRGFESKYCLIYNVFLYYLLEKLAYRHRACASTSSMSTSTSWYYVNLDCTSTGTTKTHILFVVCIITVLSSTYNKRTDTLLLRPKILSSGLGLEVFQCFAFVSTPAMDALDLVSPRSCGPASRSRLGRPRIHHGYSTDLGNCRQAGNTKKPVKVQFRCPNYLHYVNGRLV